MELDDGWVVQLGQELGLQTGLHGLIWIESSNRDFLQYLPAAKKKKILNNLELKTHLIDRYEQVVQGRLINSEVTTYS